MDNLAKMIQVPNLPEPIRDLLVEMQSQDKRIAKLETQETPKLAAGDSPPHSHDASCPECTLIARDARDDLLQDLDEAADREGLGAARDRIVESVGRLYQGLPAPASNGLEIVSG